uniref:Uncharacterized protein n=1 Tax=Leersia perrieri TaxID=77586 RepID=A0A0D9WHK1_9ORYZ
MEIVTARGVVVHHEGTMDKTSHRRPRRQRKVSDGHVVAQLLDSPLPTPRRSCCGSSSASAAGTPRSVVVRSGSCREDEEGESPPQRMHVPFSWESSPGVRKDDAACGGNGKVLREVLLPPRLPPGRFGVGAGGTPAHAHARAYFGNGNATTDTKSSDEDDGDAFSDALDRISASDRFAAFSARLSSIDGVGSLRLPSFIMDRFLPAANAIATTSADKRPKKTPRRHYNSKHDEDTSAAAAIRRAQSLRRASAREHQPKPPQPPRHHHENIITETPPPRRSRNDIDVDEEEEEARGGDETSPRACGFMLLLPWSVKPVLCGFARSRTAPRADASTVASSPPRRSVTLGNALEKEKEKEKESKLRNVSRWSDEKGGGGSGSGREWASPGWGTAILGTSKRYCADARKALSRLARSATDGRGGSTVSRERSGKPAPAAASPRQSISGEIPPLSPPSDSWLRNARGSSTVKTKR